MNTTVPVSAIEFRLGERDCEVYLDGVECPSPARIRRLSEEQRSLREDGEADEMPPGNIFYAILQNACDTLTCFIRRVEDDPERYAGVDDRAFGGRDLTKGERKDRRREVLEALHALSWLLYDGEAGTPAITLDDCCQYLGAEVHVVRRQVLKSLSFPPAAAKALQAGLRLHSYV